MKNKVKNMQSLLKKYPKIFKDSSKSMMETCMCWGIECGPGWYDLIDQLCNGLQWNTDKNDYPQVVADQVKEKYGTLRFYYHTEFDDEPTDKSHKDGVIQGMIDFAEVMSGSICETCGNPGKCNDEGWIKCECEDCKNRLDKVAKAFKKAKKKK